MRREVRVPTVDFAAVKMPEGENPVVAYLDRLAPGSRPTILGALRYVARLLSDGRVAADEFPWWRLSYKQTGPVRNKLAQDFAPATANKILAALRGVLLESWRLGLMDAETFQRASDLSRVRGSSLPAGRALDSGEIASLFDACRSDRTKAGSRDAAIFAVLYGGGLRRSEVVGLNLNSWKPDDRRLDVEMGKGRKSRLVPIPKGTGNALRKWVQDRGRRPGPLFVPVVGDRVTIRRLTPDAIYAIVRKRGDQAGLEEFSPHDLRRTFMGDLLDRGADLSTVKRLAGHAHVETTTRYDRRDESAKRRAADLLHVPTTRRRKSA